MTLLERTSPSAQQRMHRRRRDKTASNKSLHPRLPQTWSTMRLLGIAQGGLLVLVLLALPAVATVKGLNESFQASAVLSPAPAHHFMSLLVRPSGVPVSVDSHLWSIRNLHTCAPSRRLVPWHYLPFMIALWRCTPVN